ncbi:MAG: HAD family hydrolase [Phycisphaerae bacterium]|nr:HAD family hydrolase [Phycisphaerae bacterium]
MTCRILALDVDGTLVGPDNVVTPEIRQAVALADQSGIRICLATGRSYSETIGIWEQLGLARGLQPMILIGGALVSETDTRRALYHRPMDPETACRFADALGSAGYCAMAIVDSWRYDVEYYLTAHGDLADAKERWFGQMDVQMASVGSLSEVLLTPDGPDVLRVSAVVNKEDGPGLAASLKDQFGDAINVCSILAPNYNVWIVEAHATGADKRTALQYVAQATGTPLGQVAAVGDDINDISMLSSVGLGVAMPQAPRSVMDAADHTAAGGLAEFITQLVNGKFD